MPQDEVYGDQRADQLLALLRLLAARINALENASDLSQAVGPLLKMLGDVRSELFNLEVRATFDTPEVAESRRIVDEAKGQELELPSFDGFTEEDPEERDSWRE
ncbi:MAG: hypothetical protein OEY63_02845 [Gemmatimonadota bacterium]|nr:hypothetical protein [Gemmatimonadota bacterium]MDH5804108.1 hypothetical protein [Gemmatimonadota bacterium]